MTVPQVVVGVAIERDGRWLVARRTRPAHLAGLWEFPGGKVEAGESVRDAAIREIREELGVAIALTGDVPGPEGGLWPIDEKYAMAVVTASAIGQPRPRDGHDDVRWVGPAELSTVDWVPADVAVAAALATTAPAL